ncbi:hypothetical protein PL8927_830110 [Planktothrix serta PCC 8927]|uniref:Uncharacterized protein n=1 Tax=Planktothrix serta PCC 8927 TaxID=671068 RepID=A0A7Z9BXU6_9CYAN|nr:hypothetical protein PL8927_830110 [Planktothrix serta PCC 8927]
MQILSSPTENLSLGLKEVEEEEYLIFPSPQTGDESSGGKS